MNGKVMPKISGGPTGFVERLATGDSAAHRPGSLLGGRTRA
ncbi:hypothetical protein DB31_7622 [Hyalangium minutum]|uniref:Uncharacterized protein n=1 Tax=Hyalangium minutum TaxID=394096 RepID=A0A085WL22_9BACT|nr:hypothetical protein DB31_7622 [Hyalangium minutum]